MRRREALLFPKCSYGRDAPVTSDSTRTGVLPSQGALSPHHHSPSCRHQPYLDIQSRFLQKYLPSRKKQKTVQSTQHSHMTELLLRVTDG